MSSSLSFLESLVTVIALFDDLTSSGLPNPTPKISAPSNWPSKPSGKIPGHSISSVDLSIASYAFFLAGLAATKAPFCIN